LNDIIKNLYPEKISISKQSIPSTVTRTAGFSTDNEANLKIWQALDSLGYKYKKEQNRSQRNVDLVIEEKVIIEVDG
jgi:very-short-patch-repair endonuclease